MQFFLKRVSLSLKTAAALIVSLLFIAVVFNVIMYSIYKKEISDLTTSRFQIIAQDISKTLSDGLNLGLSLSELNTTQSVIDAIKKKHSDILSIGVFETYSKNLGRILYHTRSQSKNANIPLSWLEKINHPHQETLWRIFDDGIGTVGVTLFNPFKQPIGGVIVRFDQTPLNYTLFDFAKKMALMTLTILFFFFMLSFFLIQRLFAPITRSCHKMKILLTNDVIHNSSSIFIQENALEESFYTMYRHTHKLAEILSKIDQVLEKEKSFEEEWEQIQKRA